MNLLQTDRTIERYLGAVEAGLAKSDEEARKDRDKKATELLNYLKEIEVHLEQPEREEINLSRTAIDELRLQYALGKMEGTDKLLEIKERIDHRIYQVKNALRKTKKLANKDTHLLNEKLHNAWVALRVELNLLELQFELTRDNPTGKISTAIDEVREDLKLIGKLAKEGPGKTKTEVSTWVSRTKKRVRKRTHRFLESLEHHLLDTE